MTTGRKRVDVLLVERGLAETREKAQRLIRAGLVHSESEKLDKPGKLVPESTELKVKGNDCPYVSRGGLKLAGAMEHFKVSSSERVALDLGASTGGFTDYLLQHGAIYVYAVDVGRAQLHEKLRQDDRVANWEKTHMDSLEAEHFDPRPDLCVADLSFISLKRAFPVIRRIMPPESEAVLLVKPQFEAGKDKVPKGGVIRDESIQREAVENVIRAAEEAGFRVKGSVPCVIRGTEGNQEYFLYLAMDD